MAMKTKSRKTNPAASLRRRIRRFYELLNAGAFASCFDMIDPAVRNKPTSVTLLQYENALREFVERYGTITPTQIDVNLHLDEPSKLYEDRDFAMGKTVWADQSGEERVFSERWVRDGKAWYTRSTGFVVPFSGK
jgi:hypothetical protein